MGGNCCSGNSDNKDVEGQFTNDKNSKLTTNIVIEPKHLTYKTCMMPAYTTVQARNARYDNFLSFMAQRENVRHYLDIFRRTGPFPKDPKYQKDIDEYYKDAQLIVVDIDLSKKSENINSIVLKKSKSDFFKFEQLLEIQRVLKSAKADNKLVPRVFFYVTKSSGSNPEENNQEYTRFKRICESEKFVWKEENDDSLDLETKLAKLIHQVELLKLVGVERVEVKSEAIGATI